MTLSCPFGDDSCDKQDTMEPECLGKLEFVSEKPAGFFCGSVPVPTDQPSNDVPTDQPSNDFDSSGQARTVQAPRYGIIPTMTDLDMLQPIPEKVFPLIPAQSRTFEGSVLPDLICNGQLSLGTMYRVGHMLSLSTSPERRARGVRFFRQCLDILDGPHHLVLRALAHEQLSRLLLLHDKKLQSIVLPIDSEVLYGDKGDSSEVITCLADLAHSAEDHVTSPNISNAVSEKREAVYHACEAIKLMSLSLNSQCVTQEICASGFCVCGNADCFFEVCNISEWFATDEKSWELVMLLGESYLALAQAYKDEGEIFLALKAVESACVVYGSVPELENMLIDLSISSIQLEDKKADDSLGIEELSTNSPFWSRAWALVGNLYAKFKEIWTEYKLSSKRNSSLDQLEISSEVFEEIQRLHRNREQPSERAETGSTASSSSGSDLTAHGKKRIKKRSKGSSTVISSEIDNSKTSHAVEETRVEETQERKGGIFKYITNPQMGDGDGDGDLNIISALECYEEAMKLLEQNPVWLKDYKHVAKKKGVFCILLSERRMARGELDQAESAFADATVCFQETGDYAYIGVMNYTMAFKMRESARAVESFADTLKGVAMLEEQRTKALEEAKTQYMKSLSYYSTAKMEFDALEDSDSMILRDEVYLQFAHTYLKFAGLLAKYDSTDEDSVNKAISNALALYESPASVSREEDVGASVSREEDVAYAYYQLAVFQKDQCLKLLGSVTMSDDVRLRIMDYAEQAHSSWQKCLECFRPATHARTYLDIVIHQSDLPFKISKSLDLPELMETALTRLFEGRHVSETESSESDNKEVCEIFWNQLQDLLKVMVKTAIKAQENPASIAKLKQIYLKSLKTTKFSESELLAMHSMWAS